MIAPTVRDEVRLAREANHMAIHWATFETWDLARVWRNRRIVHMLKARRLKKKETKRHEH